MPERSKTKREMFGTDGVRDVANRGLMTPEAVMRLGVAYIEFLKSRGAAEKPKIAIGADTRISGDMLKSALISGITSAGGDCADFGVIPTPGVSFGVRLGGFDGGVMVSASHNPAEYNGVKFLDKAGFKLSDEDELEIEYFYEKAGHDGGRPACGGLGRLGAGTTQREDYLSYLSSLLDKVQDKSFPLAIDAANGAASQLVEPLMSRWAGKVFLYAVEPDGLNINRGVGVTHMDFICGKTVENKAKLGIAYDGDTDRVLFSDEYGRVIDGDITLWVAARWLARQGSLGAGVVATIMTNMVLEDLLQAEGIKVFRCDVGDRYVLETMQREGCRLGGEQSGHILALDYANTGDGLCSGILFLRALADLGEDPSTLVDRFERYPQVLRNLRVADNKAVMRDKSLKAPLAEAEKMLAGKGRLSLRSSGTEPLIRIFVEARDRALMDKVADYLEEEIKRVITKNG